MPVEPQKVSQLNPEEGLGSLGSCLVDGDAEQRSRERRVRLLALAISVVLQCTVFAFVVLLPLFGKTPRIAFAYATPFPPYSSYHGETRISGERPHVGPRAGFHFWTGSSHPGPISRQNATDVTGNLDEQPFDGMVPGIGYNPDGLLPIPDSRRVLPPSDGQSSVNQTKRLHWSKIDPGMLIRRVEPLYPALAKDIHKEGKVELHAIIGTDGTIQSLQIVSGDPLFLRSATEAVQQWRYRPTYLNGQPVEIDTYITVVYTMQH